MFPLVPSTTLPPPVKVTVAVVNLSEVTLAAPFNTMPPVVFVLVLLNVPPTNRTLLLPTVIWPALAPVGKAVDSVPLVIVKLRFAPIARVAFAAV